MRGVELGPTRPLPTAPTLHPSMMKIKLKIVDTEVEFEGEAEKFPRGELLPLLEAVKKSHNEDLKKDLLLLQAELEQELRNLDSSAATMSKIHEELDHAMNEFQERLKRILKSVGTLSDSGSLLNEVRQLQETQMSFNLQYLQLQSQMQHENRSYTAISNIMKTKHDTVKNTISNIR